MFNIEWVKTKKTKSSKNSKSQVITLRIELKVKTIS